MTIYSEPLAYTVADAAARLNICKAQIYKEISGGRLTARKMGRRTLIEQREVARWLAALPAMASAA